MKSDAKQAFICHYEQLVQSKYLIVPIKYKQVKQSAIIFALEKKVYAYLNYCMHMQRPLDCQEDNIFDHSEKLLRCSMHGFVFEPSNGECLSPVCAGEKLQALKIVVLENAIYFSDKHVRLWV